MEPETVTGSLRALFGENRFRNDEELLLSYSASLNGPAVKPFGVVFPVNISEVVSLLKIANENGLKVFPISKGKNFGYGEAQGTDPGQLIVDLSRMNQIIAVNEQLAYATIQPGVTQEMLFEFLTTSKSKL